MCKKQELLNFRFSLYFKIFITAGREVQRVACRTLIEPPKISLERFKANANPGISQLLRKLNMSSLLVSYVSVIGSVSTLWSQ